MTEALPNINEALVPQDESQCATVAAAQEDGQASPAPQKPPEPPLPSLRALLFGNALALAFFLWVDIGPLIQGLHQDDSAFRGTPYASPWPFYALGLAAIAAIAALALCRLIRHGPNPADRSFRLLPIAAIIFVALHLLFIRSVQDPHLPPSMIMTGIFATTALKPLTSDDGRFPTSPQFYADALAETPPPYWRNGEKLSRWNVLIREHCTGPIDTLPGAVEPGTLLVCLSEDRQRAWMSAVGLSRDVVGTPALVQAQQNLLAVPLQIQKKSAGSGERASTFQ